jgi:Zn-dependent protease with chaperone function
MKYEPWKLRTGYAGLGIAALVAFTAAGLSPLLPVVLVPAVYAVRRWSPLDAWVEKRSYERMTEKLTEIKPGHPLHERVAAMAARMDAPVPRIYLAPPRLGAYDVFTFGSINRRMNDTHALVLPATLFTVTTPDRAAVFTPAEQDAVIAHELSHVRNNDSHMSIIPSSMQRMTSFGAIMAWAGGIFGFVAAGPVLIAAGAMMAGTVLSRMCTRQIEYRADMEAVTACGDARALASALEKLESINAHMFDFSQNAREITQDDSGRGWITSFRPRKPEHRVVQTRPSMLTALLVRYLSTHPDQMMRYDHIRARAAAEGQGNMPINPPSVEFQMREHLQRTHDGIILPPFAIPETLVRDAKTGHVAVATGLTSMFNAAARGDEPPSLRKLPPPPARRETPPPPGPWG